MKKREWKTVVKLGLGMGGEDFKYACKKSGVEIREMVYLGGTLRKRYEVVLYGDDIQFYELAVRLGAI